MICFQCKNVKSVMFCKHFFRCTDFEEMWTPREMGEVDMCFTVKEFETKKACELEAIQEAVQSITLEELQEQLNQSGVGTLVDGLVDEFDESDSSINADDIR